MRTITELRAIVQSWRVNTDDQKNLHVDILLEILDHLKAQADAVKR